MVYESIPSAALGIHGEVSDHNWIGQIDQEGILQWETKDGGHHYICQYYLTQSYDKLRQIGRINQIQEPNIIRHELETLKDEIHKLTQHIQCNQRDSQRSQERIPHTPIVDDRRRSASLGYKKATQPREVTPKITEIAPPIIHQNIHSNISKHHLDDTEIKQAMRDQFKDRPPKPSVKYPSSDNGRRTYDHSDHDNAVHVDFDDTDRYPVKDNHIPQVLQYSHLQQSLVSQQSTEHHNSNQTFAQPQSSQKQLTISKSMHNPSTIVQKSPRRSPRKSPKFKYQKQSKKNLEPVVEETSQSFIKRNTSTHSASSRSKASQPKPNTQAVSKIKALLDQDKKIHKKQQDHDQLTDREFTNPYEPQQPILTLKNYQQEEEEYTKQIQSQRHSAKSSIKQQKTYQDQVDVMDNISVPRRTFQGSFYNPSNIPKLNDADNLVNYQVNPQSYSQSMTNNQQRNRKLELLQQQQHQQIQFYQSQDPFILTPPIKYKGHIKDQVSPNTYAHIRSSLKPSSMGKQDSDIKRSDDFNRSSVSSTFSMFNPNDELKMFFQNDFMERKKYIPQGSELTKQSSVSSYDNNYQSKYITTSQIEDYPKHFHKRDEYSNVSQDVEKSNVFQNNRLSVTRILNNSQI